MRRDFDHLHIGDKVVYKDEHSQCSGIVVKFLSNDEVSIDFYDDYSEHHIGEVFYDLSTLNNNYCFSLIRRCEPVNLEEII